MNSGLGGRKVKIESWFCICIERKHRSKLNRALVITFLQLNLNSWCVAFGFSVVLDFG